MEMTKNKEMRDYKGKIVKSITSMAGTFSEYEIFTDWVKAMALSIQNSCWIIHDKYWQEREKMYVAIAEKHGSEGIIKFSEMMAWLTEAYEEEISDVLGEVFMSKELGSSTAGQFFTPFHISEMTADIATLSDDQGYYSINEPSCGSGGMIVAVAKTLQKRGIPYQKKMRVVAQDLDWNAVYMCYVQMSLLGIYGIAVQGSTLTDPYDKRMTERSHILYTPKKMGVLL